MEINVCPIDDAVGAINRVRQQNVLDFGVVEVEVLALDNSSEHFAFNSTHEDVGVIARRFEVLTRWCYDLC